MWYYNTNYLCHHGVKGQKWGTRKYQNEDGSLTAEGRVHYGYGKEARRKEKEMWKDVKRQHKALGKNFIQRAKEVSKAHEGKGSEAANRYLKSWDAAEKYSNKLYKEKMAAKEANKGKNVKTALKVGAVVAGTALAAYGGYKLGQHIKGKAANDIINRGQETARQYFDLARQYQNKSDKFATSYTQRMNGIENIKRGAIKGVDSSNSAQYERMAKAISDRSAARSYAEKSANLSSRGTDILRRYGEQSKDVGSSVVKSAKYLYEHRKKR